MLCILCQKNDVSNERIELIGKCTCIECSEPKSVIVNDDESLGKWDLARKMWDEGKLVSEISEAYGIKTISPKISILRGKHGWFPRRHKSSKIDIAVVKKLWDENKNVAEIAEHYDVNIDVMYRFMSEYRKLGMFKPHVHQDEAKIKLVKIEPVKINTTVENMIIKARELWTEGKSIDDMSKMLGIPSSSVRKMTAKLNDEFGWFPERKKRFSMDEILKQAYAIAEKETNAT